MPRSRNASRKESRALSLEQLLTLAAADAKLSVSTWKRIAQTFEVRPEAARELAEEREKVPRGPARDLVVSALRRICWPSERLPARHRRAAREVGSVPFAFLSLALEEARTASWRAFDGEALATMTRWLSELPLKAIDEEASRVLVFEARAYQGLFEIRFGEDGKLAREFFAFMQRVDNYSASPALVEAYFAVALIQAVCGESAACAECFADAEILLEKMNAEDVGELRAFLKLCRGWAEGILRVDKWKEEYLITEGLGMLDQNSDPWLALFLHHEAARAIVRLGATSLPSAEEMFERGFENLTATNPEERTAAIAWLRERLSRHASAERDAIARVRAHLEAAEALFSELGTEGFAISYLWLESHSLIHTDPIQGIDLIMEAMKLASAAPQGWRARAVGSMTLDTFYLLCQLKDSGESQERIEACVERMDRKLRGGVAGAPDGRKLLKELAAG